MTCEKNEYNPIIVFICIYKFFIPHNTHWKNAQFNKLLVQARAELDETKRRDMYAEMQRILRDEGGAIVPMFANAIDARTDKVNHGKVSGITPFDGRRIIERWWLV